MIEAKRAYEALGFRIDSEHEAPYGTFREARP